MAAVKYITVMSCYKPFSIVHQLPISKSSLSGSESDESDSHSASECSTTSKSYESSIFGRYKEYKS